MKYSILSSSPSWGDLEYLVSLDMIGLDLNPINKSDIEYFWSNKLPEDRNDKDAS